MGSTTTVFNNNKDVIKSYQNCIGASNITMVLEMIALTDFIPIQILI